MNFRKIYERKSPLAQKVKVDNIGFLLTALFPLMLLLTVPCDSLAQSVLSDDADVSFSSGNGNHGTHPALVVSNSSAAYLKFRIAAVLPAGTPGAKIAKATIKMYIGKVSTPGKVDVYFASGSWSEATITANNAPPVGALIVTTESLGNDREGNFIVLDLTSAVRQWLGTDGQGTGGVPNNGIVLVPHPIDSGNPQTIDVSFDSKENSQTSHEARLDVVLDGSAGDLQAVAHDATLTGDGTAAAPLGVAPGAITSTYLADNAVTPAKIADNAVETTKLADGSVTSAKVAVPLSLTSGDANFTFRAANTGSGAAITAAGAINTSTQYNIGGQRILGNPGTNNLVAGIDAGTSNTIGTANAFFGKNAGRDNVSGSSNTFVGFNAGAGSTTGGNNSFFGDAAGFRNAAGDDNSFFGFLAGFNNTANLNSFFGSLAGADNTTGFRNSYFGSFTGVHNTTGSQNAFFGSDAGSTNTSGSNNSFFGSDAGRSNSTGFQLSFFGREAGRDNTTGSFNSFFGRSTGRGNTTGSGNSFFGQDAGIQNTTGNNNAFYAVAAGQGNTTGSSNAFFGTFAGDANITGSNNTAIGSGADVGAPGLSFATAIGSGAIVNASNTLMLGRAVDTVEVPGGLNVAGTFGANILNATTQFNIGGSRFIGIPGFQNIFIGTGTGAVNTTGFGNTFLGFGVGVLNTDGWGNTFIGQRVGEKNTSGCCNSFMGNGAGLLNTIGRSNVFIGGSSGGTNTTGSFNTFIGDIAAWGGGAPGQGNSSGDSNTFVGYGTGINNTTGDNNTLLGTGANTSTGNLTFATAIGAGTTVATSNTVVLGRAADTVQVPGTLNVSGAFGANILNATTQFNIGGFRVLGTPGIGNLLVGTGQPFNPGTHNSFFGSSAGNHTTTGGNNAFFGFLAGFSNITGADNAYFGERAGTTATGSGNSFFGQFAGGNFTGGGNNNTFVGSNADFDVTAGPGSNNTLLGANSKIDMIGFGQDISFATAIGAGAAVQFSDMVIIGKVAGTYDGVARPADIVRIPGLLQVQSFGPPGGNPLCFNNGIAFCSSSLRYKADVQPYFGGLDVMKRLMPITYTWKSNGSRDLGFGAEDVAKIEPLLTFKNAQGDIEGVNYGHITTVLVNAVKEQQAHIEAQARLIAELKRLVCNSNRKADVCRKKEQPK